MTDLDIDAELADLSVDVARMHQMFDELAAHCEGVANRTEKLAERLIKDKPQEAVKLSEACAQMRSSVLRLRGGLQ